MFKRRYVSISAEDLQRLCINPPPPKTKEEEDAKLLAEAYEEIEEYLNGTNSRSN